LQIDAEKKRLLVGLLALVHFADTPWTFLGIVLMLIEHGSVRLCTDINGSIGPTVDLQVRPEAVVLATEERSGVWKWLGIIIAT
jgi:hypothetical protein